MDGFHKPQPNKAPLQSVISAVLRTAAKFGASAVSLMAGLLAASLMLFSAYVLYDTFYTQEKAFSSWELLSFKPQIITDGADPLDGQDKLSAINKDYRAWLTLYETNIDYPVMQGKDDQYYAYHDVYGESSLTGAIYLATGNTFDLSDAYNLIFGHHMDNEAMFGGLDKYSDEEYVNGHKSGVLVTPTRVYDLEVFAVADTDAYDEAIMDAGPDRTAYSVVEYLRNPSERTTVRYFDEEAAEDAGKVVALSTCLSAGTDARRVVFCVAKLKNLMEIELPSYDGVYDGLTHTVEASVNYPDGTTVEYSIDGGETWSTELPSITDVGTFEVVARATNENYGVAETTATLTVRPAPVTVYAIDSGKNYGDPDPELHATVEGVIGMDNIEYTVTRPGAGTDELPGKYEGAVVPSGDKYQGNYVVTYVPADFTITENEMAIYASGYTGMYDAKPHVPTVTVTVTDGTAVEYSVDGGVTWTSEVPSITNVGEMRVTVRATNPGYKTVTAEVVLKVTPRPVVVTAKNAQKTEGDADPAFEATVEGVIDGYRIVYTVSRNGGDEVPGTYVGVIVPSGGEYQGNYVVTYVPADFIINAKADVPVPPTPDKPHNPQTGGFFGDSAWALLNLICVILTVYLLMPVFHLRDKFGRSKLMKQLNGAAGDTHVEYEDVLTEDTEEDGEDEDGPLYRVRKFLRRLIAGVGLEILTAVAAIIVFILTEDMRNPMIFVDRWTPLMLLILLIAWIIDVRLARYREKSEEDPEDESTEKKEIGDVNEK
ncbi:MAG: sortase [Clostridia bacterium]|nr:sortase [Clostridia bacterium]